MAETVSARADDWALAGVGVPRRLRDATFATSRPTAALNLARAFFERHGIESGRLFGLLGPTGVGKTWAAAALVNADLTAQDPTMLFVNDRQSRWALCASLLDELRDFHSRREAMKAARRGRLLVLDDLQAPRSQDASGLLEEILIQREQEGLAVVFTSNLKRRQLEQVLSDRVLDRFRAWGELYEVRGESLR